MKTRTTLGSCAVLLIATSAFAQNQRYYPQQQPQGGYTVPPPYTQPAPNYQQPAPGYGQGYAYPQQPQRRYENPIEFLPKFGKRMSEMVRRVFYGQNSNGYDNPPQGGNYSLDSSPRHYQAPAYPKQPAPSYPQQPGAYQYPPQQPGQVQQPRYSYPPQQALPPAPRSQQPAPQTKSTPPAPSTQNKSSTRTYSPPKVTQSPPKTTSKPAPAPTRPKQTVTQAPAPTPPPPTTTTRRSESTPREQPAPSGNTSSLGSGSFLKGKKAAKPGRVISPYPPYKELDITGLESGSLALDPTTQKVFEVP